MTVDVSEREQVAETNDAAPGRSLRRKLLLVGGATIVLAALGIGYSVYAAVRPDDSAYTEREITSLAEPGLYLRDASGYVVRQGGPGQVAGDGGSAASERAGLGLDCFRYYASGTRGVCVRPQGGLKPMTTVEILNTDLSVRESFKFAGVPSRARVSPTGRFFAWTVFVTGDSYATTNFSTRTGVYDLERNYLVDSIEELQLFIDGKRVRRPDVNYWGMTFAEDDNTFYATVATGGKTYLVKGDYANWSATALRENVECPSLSPDGTRIAFKKRVNDGVDDPWRLHVLDLATMEETPLAEDRNVDDQASWLDDGTIAYEVGGDVWSVPADGSGKATLIAEDASSPAQVR